MVMEKLKPAVLLLLSTLTVMYCEGKLILYIYQACGSIICYQL